jgi:hypothetical protein
VRPFAGLNGDKKLRVPPAIPANLSPKGKTIMCETKKEINNSIKEINKNFINDVLPKLIQRDILPIGQLIIFFHAANGLGTKWGKCDDAPEERNYKFLKKIKPSFGELYIQSFVSGSFKPEKFIHPFEGYYTTSGKHDIKALQEFFFTTDIIAKDWDNSIKPEHYLSYVYIVFLAIHPFVDGNGRVARNLLDYYNDKLSLKLRPVWNNLEPVNKVTFCKEAFHKQAFKDFFAKDMQITTVPIADIYDVPVLRKDELMNMAKKMIRMLQNIGKNKVIDSPAVLTMAQGIKELSDVAKRHEG